MHEHIVARAVAFGYRLSLAVMVVLARHTIFVFAAPLEPFDGANNHGRREDGDHDE